MIMMIDYEVDHGCVNGMSMVKLMEMTMIMVMMIMMLVMVMTMMLMLILTQIIVMVNGGDDEML